MIAKQPILKIRNLSLIFGSQPTKAIPFLENEQKISRDEISARTGQVVAVRSVNLSVETGEFFVMMGLSGSGKSTLLRAVNGLIAPTTGEVILDHQGREFNLAKATESELRQLRQKRFSMVFQHFGLMPWRTVSDNIALGLEGLKIPREVQNKKIQEILAMVNLEAWANKYPHQLSGGMQQRVGLARALVTDADILLMDEPFSALDPLIRYDLQQMLIDLQVKSKKTIIFVSHDFDEAIKLGHRIGIMQDGWLVKVGTPQELIQGGEMKISVPSIQVDHQPMALTNAEGQCWGVVGGPEIFRRILSSSSTTTSTTTANASKEVTDLCNLNL